jgi:hypothetical protein
MTDGTRRDYVHRETVQSGRRCGTNKATGARVSFAEIGRVDAVENEKGQVREVVIRKRLYTRYPFSASATVADDSSVEIPAQVTTIGAGGCRLVTSARFSVGARVTVRIRKDKDYFEAPANVAHCAEDGMGLMFHGESTESLRVLIKWLKAKERIAVEEKKQ